MNFVFWIICGIMHLTDNQVESVKTTPRKLRVCSQILEIAQHFAPIIRQVHIPNNLDAFQLTIIGFVNILFRESVQPQTTNLRLYENAREKIPKASLVHIVSHLINRCRVVRFRHHGYHASRHSGGRD